MADSSNSEKSSRVVDAVKNNAQEVIREDFTKVKTVALDAAKSRSWLYPIKGFLYFITHRNLWKPFLSRLPPYIALYGVVTVALFTFTYLPQLSVLIFVNGPLAVFTTVVLVLNESATIVNVIARQYLLYDALLDTFDGTLLAQKEGGIVKEGREVKPGSDPSQRLGKVLKHPFQKFSINAVVRYFMYLPLNFIPVVGTAIFLFLQARGRGRGVHDRYFQLKKWSASQSSDWVDKYVGPYTGFGVVATLLEMIPIVSLFFTYTNTVGAALWAADIEANGTSMTDRNAPSLQESTKRTE